MERLKVQATLIVLRFHWFILVAAGSALLTAAAVLGLLGQGMAFAAALCLTAGLPVLIFGLVVLASELKESKSRTLALEVQVESLAHESLTQRDAVDQFAAGLDMMILVVDAKHRLIYANPQARANLQMEKVFGQQLLTKTFSRELEDLVAAAFETGEPKKGELSFNHPEDRIGQVQVWAEPPTFTRCFISIVDITSLRRMERSRQDFVANVSHELRTPMASIRAMAEVLQEERDDLAIQERYLGAIIHEVDRLAAVTSELLTLSMVESKGLTKAPVRLVECLERAVHRMEHKAEEKSLALSWTAEADPVISINASLIQQVIQNLVDNAINYTLEGTVHVAMRVDEGEAVVSVRDTGSGIAGEHLPRLFERFYRVDKGRSRAKGGTGLGLSIVKHIVEAHGGRVWVESVYGQGSTFGFSLPLDAGIDELQAGFAQ